MRTTRAIRAEASGTTGSVLAGGVGGSTTTGGDDGVGVGLADGVAVGVDVAVREVLGVGDRDPGATVALRSGTEAVAV
ncbi:MAG TPA: hypothetical protein VFU98_11980, partial [Microlunatus sp.]|nr:hypothetical protein [Microlunatus sp.]